MARVADGGSRTDRPISEPVPKCCVWGGSPGGGSDSLWLFYAVSQRDIRELCILACSVFPLSQYFLKIPPKLTKKHSRLPASPSPCCKVSLAEDHFPFLSSCLCLCWGSFEFDPLLQPHTLFLGRCLCSPDGCS